MPDLVLLERLTAELIVEAIDAYDDGQHELSQELFDFAELCRDTRDRAAA
jgi:hypothetical protein